MHTVEFYLIRSSCVFFQLNYYGLEQKEHWITLYILANNFVVSLGAPYILFCELTSLTVTVAIFACRNHVHYDSPK